MVTIWILIAIWVFALVGIGVLIWRTEGETDEFLKDAENK